MRRLLPLLLLAFPVAAQQMPASVERPLAPIPPSAPPPEATTGAGFIATGQLATMAATTTAVPSLSPSATLRAPPAPSVNPYAPPPPQPQLSIRPVGTNRYIILPQESPLATAPMATVNGAAVAIETETALPEVWHEAPIAIPTGNLAVQPQLVDVPTQPERGITWQPAQQATPPTQPDLTTRLTDMADRLESMSEQAEALDARLTAAEEKPALQAAPQPITSVVPYVNDTTAPGPKARVALDNLAAKIIAAHQQTGVAPKNMSVTATVALPPLGEQNARQLGRARHAAAWSYLNAKLKAAGISLPGTGNSLAITETKNPAAQSQKITINY